MQFGRSQSALSQHLRKLKQVGAVKVRHEAQCRFIRSMGIFLLASGRICCFLFWMHNLYAPDRPQESRR